MRDATVSEGGPTITIRAPRSVRGPDCARFGSARPTHGPRPWFPSPAPSPPRGCCTSAPADQRRVPGARAHAARVSARYPGDHSPGSAPTHRQRGRHHPWADHGHVQRGEPAGRPRIERAGRHRAGYQREPAARLRGGYSEQPRAGVGGRQRLRQRGAGGQDPRADRRVPRRLQRHGRERHLAVQPEGGGGGSLRQPVRGGQQQPPPAGVQHAVQHGPGGGPGLRAERQHVVGHVQPGRHGDGLHAVHAGGAVAGQRGQPLRDGSGQPPRAALQRTADGHGGGHGAGADEHEREPAQHRGLARPVQPVAPGHRPQRHAQPHLRGGHGQPPRAGVEQRHRVHQRGAGGQDPRAAERGRERVQHRRHRGRHALLPTRAGAGRRGQPLRGGQQQQPGARLRHALHR